VNLTTYFLLPLTGAQNGAHDFGEKMFVNSFILNDSNDDKIVVKTRDYSSKNVYSRLNFIDVKIENPYFYYVYKIYDEFLPDVALFKKGKYSEFNSKAVSMIMKSTKFESHKEEVSAQMMEDIREKVRYSPFLQVQACYCEGINYRIASPMLAAVTHKEHKARIALASALTDKVGVKVHPQFELMNPPNMEEEYFNDKSNLFKK
jgi:hypothetical protein